MATLKSGLRYIRRRLSKAVRQCIQPEPFEVVSVPIAACRHYCGFKYGSGAFNPYENYIVGLHQGDPKPRLRRRFEEFLTHYRPRDFGEVFGLRFSSHVPLWVYPWTRGRAFDPRRGWFEDIEQVPDILTHFSEAGIMRSRIEEEYFWLERAYSRITTQGYQPEVFGYMEVFELRDSRQSVFVVKDGNHRLSALVALGHREVVVERLRHERVDVAKCAEWSQVREGLYSLDDALAVFNAYFAGVDGFVPSPRPARVVEA